MRTRLRHALNPTDGNPSYNVRTMNIATTLTITCFFVVVRITKPENHSFEEAL